MAHDYSYFDPDYIPLSETIPPLNVCFDNETCDDCTLLKVVGANRHGILLKMVQVFSDLGLIISKSHISSDGGWFMNVFHVTDQHGHKIRDSNLIDYTQQSLNIAQRQNGSSSPAQVKIIHDNIVCVDHFDSYCTALEITSIDYPGILSEVSDVLFKLSYYMESGELWTHNGRIACILYIKDQDTGESICDRARFNYLGQYLANVVDAHHLPDELWNVRLQGSMTCRIHTRRRLHQLMQLYKNYEVEPLPLPVDEDQSSFSTSMMKGKRSLDSGNEGNKVVHHPQVSIENWKEKDYLVVNVRSRDRPKLIFDTVCVLTDLDYDVFHGSITAHGSVVVQEYFVRRTNGCTMLGEMEKQNVVRSLAATVDRRTTQGLKMEVRTLDRPGLLSNVSRALRENSLSLEKAEFAVEDGLAVGTFYLTNASPSVDTNDIDQQRLEAVRKEIGRGVSFEKKNDSITSSPARGRWSLFSKFYSLGKSTWSHIKRFFSNFRFIR